jgi:hypothetical protein
MSERIQNTPEYNEKNQEALDETNRELSAELAHERNKNIERNQKDNQEVAKQEALEAANKAEKDAKQEEAPKEKRRDTISERKSKQKANFNKTMSETQAHMSPAVRSFSKLIHNKSVEKTSEVIGSTVARPNAILAGSVTAFSLSLVIYLIANYNGYPLSGSETIAAFIIGWVIGLLFDYIRVMVTGKKS